MLGLTLHNVALFERTLRSLGDKVRFRCEIARQWEDAGEYEAAGEALGEYWAGVGERPETDGMDDGAAAVLLLRAGTLTAYIGSAEQMPGASEGAKDLLSESLRLAETCGDERGAIEAGYELAYCYFRDGAFDEARVLLREGRERCSESGGGGGGDDDDLMARLLVRSAFVEYRANRPEDALKFLEAAAPLVEGSDNNLLRGKFHVERATTFKNLGAVRGDASHFDRALIDYAAASFYFEQAGHERYRARVENNCGMLYLQMRRFADAHEHLDKALRFFEGLGDVGAAAQVRESKARAYLDEGRYGEAERLAGKAVQTLEAGGHAVFLAEALTTQGAALARLGRFDEANRTLRQAMDAAETAGDINYAGRAALVLLEEVGSELTREERMDVYLTADRLLGESGKDDSPSLTRLLRLARPLIEELQHTLPISDTSVSGVLASDVSAGSTLEVRKEEKTVNLSEALEGGSLADAVRRYEGGLIELALKLSDNSVTQAARLLGVSHQSLSLILHSRHQELKNGLKQRKRRQQHIVRKNMNDSTR